MQAKRTMIGRYSRALVGAVRVEEALDRVQSDLASISSLLGREGELRSVLDSPVIADEKKRAVADKVFELAGLQPESRRFLTLLAVNGRLPLLDEIRGAISALADERRGTVSAEVVTAVPLSPGKLDEYRTRLEEVTGGHVKVAARVDAAIIGGVVTRIGSEVFDGSIRSRLARLHGRLRRE